MVCGKTTAWKMWPTPEGFARNPKLVHEFYNARRARLHDADVQPNAAHIALARLQQALPGRVTLVTQNVDDLHERAGSTEVLHMHGSLLALRCLYCDSVAHDWHGDCSQQTACPTCKRAGGMRPDIVWFGEMPYYMETIEEKLERCTHFAATRHLWPCVPGGRIRRTRPPLRRGHQRKSTSNPAQGRHNSTTFYSAKPRWKCRAGWIPC